jgi:hypothetical protein
MTRVPKQHEQLRQQDIVRNVAGIIRGYNAINLKNGYSQLDIRSPKEIIRNED